MLREDWEYSSLHDRDGFSGGGCFCSHTNKKWTIWVWAPTVLNSHIFNFHLSLHPSIKYLMLFIRQLSSAQDVQSGPGSSKHLVLCWIRDLLLIRAGTFYWRKERAWCSLTSVCGRSWQVLRTVIGYGLGPCSQGPDSLCVFHQMQFSVGSYQNGMEVLQLWGRASFLLEVALLVVLVLVWFVFPWAREILLYSRRFIEKRLKVLGSEMESVIVQVDF